MRQSIKQIIFLILLICLGLGLSRGQSHGFTITKSFNDQSLHSIFKWLENTHDIKVAYEETTARNIFIDQQFLNTSLNQFFTKLLTGTPLTFHIVAEDKVLVGPKQPALTSKEAPFYQISGVVIDSLTGTPLPFANIIDPITQQGTNTDENGQFSFTINRANSRLNISYVGYQSQQIIITPKEQRLMIRLQPEIIEFEDVIIFDRLPTLTIDKTLNAMTLDFDRLGSLPAFPSGMDVNRNIQLLPGVAAFDDLSAGLKVRGSAADENMVLLDNLPLYNINHFYGVFSAIHPDIVQQVNVYKNDFPIEYSGYTAGVIEMKTDDPALDQFSAKLGIDLITAKGMIKAPLAKNMNVLLAGRTTHQNVANSGLFDLLQNNSEELDNVINSTREDVSRPSLLRIQPDFKFYDVFGKWGWKINDQHKISVSFYNGFDQYDYNYREDFNFVQRGFRVRNTETNSETSSWENTAAGLLYERRWSERLSTSANFSYSQYRLDNEQLFALTRNRSLRPDTTRSSSIFQNNNIEGYRMDLKNTWVNTPTGQLTFGYTYVENKTQFDFQNDDNRQQNRFDVAHQHIAYGKQSLQLFDKLSLGFGLSATLYDKTDQVYLSPRANLNYSITDQMYLKGAWTINHQFLRQIYYEDLFGENQTFWVLANDRRFNPIPTASSRHFMVGANLLLNRWEFDIELYHRKMEGVVEYALRNPGFDRRTPGFAANRIFTLFNGEGSSKGIDLLIKKTGKNYSGWLAYTLSETLNAFPQINAGNSYPAQDDRRHQLKFVNQYRWKNWSFSGIYIFASGRPYLDLSRITENPIDRIRPNYAQNITRLRDYHRFDIGAEYSFELFKQKSKIGLSVINLFDHNNVKYRQFAYSFESDEPTGTDRNNQVIGTELQMLGRLLNVSFGIQF